MTHLKTIRQKHALKQEEIAKAIGVAVSTYSMYESNKLLIPQNAAFMIAKQLNLDFNDYFIPVKYRIIE